MADQKAPVRATEEDQCPLCGKHKSEYFWPQVGLHQRCGCDVRTFNEACELFYVDRGMKCSSNTDGSWATNTVS